MGDDRASGQGGLADGGGSAVGVDDGCGGVGAVERWHGGQACGGNGAGDGGD